MSATTSTRGRQLTLLHIVHARVWRGREHACRVEGCTGFTGEPPTHRLDVWGPDGPPPGVAGVDVTMLRVLQERADSKSP